MVINVIIFGVENHVSQLQRVEKRASIVVEHWAERISVQDFGRSFCWGIRADSWGIAVGAQRQFKSGISFQDLRRVAVFCAFQHQKRPDLRRFGFCVRFWRLERPTQGGTAW